MWAEYPDHVEAERFSSLQLAEDPAALYHQVRQRYGPVAPIVLDGGIPAWFVLGYRELNHVASNPQRFARDSRRWNAWDLVPDDWSLMPYVAWTPSVMFTEGPEHKRRAAAIGDALDTLNRTELTSVCEHVADELVDAFAGDGEADLVAQYAHPNPARVTAKLFGLPESDIAGLVQDIFDSLDFEKETAQAYQRLYERMRHLVADRRARPRQDIPSLLLAHPAGLTDDESVIDLLVMLAAQAPTGNWIGNTLRLMLVDDQFAVTLQGGRSSADQALTEVLWKNTPTQNFIGRWATRSCDLGGRRVRKGDLLVLGLAAANTDPQVRPEPHESGANRAHMSFGHGEHGCPFPAPELAEIMARTAIEVLLDRLPDIELGVSDSELRWRPSVWMRGLASLPVVFTPTVSRGPGTP
nr:cytochrome P450 [Lipingzhangella halophila]